MNLQIFKLDLDNTEEPEIKLPTFTGSLKKQESSRKTSTFALLTMPKPLTVWFTTNCGKFLKSWEYQTTWPASWKNLYAGQEATVRTGHGTTDWFQIRKEYIKAVYCHPAYLTYIQSTSWETLGWRKHKLESRLPGKYKQPQICGWYHSNGRKQRGNKEPLDEGEGGEWKSWLKNKILKKLRSWHPAPLLHAK